MTTIRKIVTSKIDGDNANNNSTSEVRPFGEMAVYLDTDNNGGPDKLEDVRPFLYNLWVNFSPTFDVTHLSFQLGFS